MNKFISKIEQLQDIYIFLFSTLLLIIIGVIDYITGQDFSFYIFYAIPVLITTWFAGRKYAIYLIFITVVFWFLDNFYNRPTHLISINPFWEIFVQTIFFLVVIIILSSLKKSMEDKKNLEINKMKRELEIAREVQTKLYPQIKPSMNGLDYCGICFPAEAVGGDYYDYIKLSENEIAFAIGDVSGHGLGPALLMAGLVGFVRSNAALYKGNISDFANSINLNLCEMAKDNMFATFFYSLYNDSQKSLRYINAGHNPPLHFKFKDKIFERLTSGDLLIGAFPEATFKEISVHLEKDDLLILYTDGVTETFDSNSEMFGEEKLKSLIEENSTKEIQEIISIIQNELKIFSGNSSQADDITLLIIRVK